MKKSKLKTIVKFLIIIAVFFLFLLITLHSLIHIFEEDIADFFLKKIISKSPGIHAVTYDDVDLDLFTGSIRIKNLSINPGRENPDTVKTTLPLVKIEGISILKSIFRKSFYIKKFNIKDGEIIFLEGLYTLRVRELKFSKAGSSIHITSLELIPKYERYRFSKIRGYRSNRLFIKVKSLVFKEIGLKELFKERKLHVKTLKIKNPQIDIFRDKHIPKHPSPTKKKFPQQLLRELKFKFRIDNIKLAKGKVTYTEHNAGEKLPGKLSFSDISANLKNLANDPELLQKQVSLVISASAKLMGKSLFRFNVTMPINDKRNLFKFSGSLGRIDLKEFRSMMENNAHIRINSGVVKQLTFSAKADRSRAIGEMRLLYNNLKISLLKRGGAYKKKKFLSFLSNAIIYNDNPKPGKTVRVGNIAYEWENRIPILSYLWKSLLSGFKSSIVLTKSKRGR